jgi:chromosome segregation protein
MTKEHVSQVNKETDEQINKYEEESKQSDSIITESKQKTENLSKKLQKTQDELAIRSKDILRLELIEEKKQTLKRFSEEVKDLEKEKAELESKKQGIEKRISSIRSSEENYDSLRLEVQELERKNEKTAGMEATLKQREVERVKNIIRQISREIEEQEQELEEIIEQIDEKQESLESKNEQDKMLKDKFKKILEEKTQHQEKIRFFESDLLHKQNNKHTIEEKINNLKIERAQFLAQKEAVEQESKEFKGCKIMRLSIEELRKRLDNAQQILNNLGSVNMRALEVYEDIKKEYDKVQEKADMLMKEKDEILKVIEDIDKKKKKVFLETLKQINELFSRNFSQLSAKGVATLDPNNKEDIFKGGIDMIIKVGKGKYFDTHSLSGGEQSLVSLALIFAIQEYKPYCFYIFDEIDAALDRRNSERLAMLLKKYMKNGQYIIITHNDSLITEAPIIYGVSMQDKISKVLSLEV